MKEIIKRDDNSLVHNSRENFKGKIDLEKSTIDFSEIEGDVTCYAGQVIVMMVRMTCENNNAYSPESRKGFKVDLMAGILKELGITLEDLKKHEESQNDVME